MQKGARIIVDNLRTRKSRTKSRRRWSLALRFFAVVAVCALVLSPLNPLLREPLSVAVTAGGVPCEQTVSNTSTVTVGAILNSNGDVAYCVLTFTSGTNSWTPPTGVDSVRFLVIGGGGSGGSGIGGGGGAGEMVESSSYAVSAGTAYSISVGAGGGANSGPGLAGSNSIFGSITAYGGGGGGQDGNGASASQGTVPYAFGSGGGAGFTTTGLTNVASNSVRNLPSGVNTYRSNGGAGSGGGGPTATAGGGGGAGGVGSPGTMSPQSGGNGGIGRTNDITGNSFWYAAGGGGGINGDCGALSGGNPGAGGSLVGGAGGTKAICPGGSPSNGNAGTSNTGSGGGGASNSPSGGAGGSGVVIVRYAIQAPASIGFSPSITGNLVQGSVITADPMSWTFSPTSVTYQWQRSDTMGTWTDISGATSRSYTLTASDVGKYLWLVMTGTNAIGSTSRTLEPVGRIAAEVTYDYASADGGTRPATNTYTPGGTSITLPTPTKTGSTFQGWYSASSGGSLIGTAGASYSPSASTTLYARWTLNTYAVSLSRGTSGTGSDQSVTKTYGQSLTLPSSTEANSWFTRTGYTVTGWSTSTAGTTSDYALAGSYTANSATTLYPVWTANSNTVTFGANNGTGTMANQSITTDVSTALTSNSFTRTGYTFSSWNTVALGGGTSYTNGQVITLTGPMNLFAQWSPNSNTITFDANTGSGTMVSQSITTNVATALTTNSFTKTGYSFAGWATTSGGAVAYSNSQSVTLTGGLDLYAKWTANSNTVTFNSNTGSGSMSSQSITTDVATSLTTNSFTKSGYTFAGWATSAGGAVVYTNSQSVTLTGGLDLFAKWTANSNVITFNANDGSGSPSTTTQNVTSGISTALSANGFTRTGYTFSGWNSAANGSGTAYANSVAVTVYASATLYAQWTPDVYTVTYNSNSGSGTAARSSDSYTVGTAAITLPSVGSLNRTGYTFDGWATTSGGTKISGTYTPTASITLYARWVANSYSITYDDNSATSGSPSVTSASYTTGGSAITLATQSTMAKTGYTFNGWSTTINNVSTKITNSGSYTITAPVVLYALWTAVDYTVTYSGQNSTGGTVPVDATAYHIGDSAVIKANVGALVRTGYSFAGWTIASDGSGTVYQSGDTFSIASSSITLYPKWTANTYTITYNANGASGSASRTTDSYTTGNVGISLPAVGTMVKTGYDFAGWSPSPTGSALNNNGYTTTSSLTLYAVWTLKSINFNYVRGTAAATTLTGSHVATFPSTATQTGLFGSTITLDSSVSNVINVLGNAYQFMGWNDTYSIYSRSDAFTLGASSSTFTAEWVRLYEVRYALNGGTGVVDIDDECQQAGNTCLANQSIHLHGAPTRAGYTFEGWKDQSGTVFAAGAAATVTTNSFLYYAQWVAVDYTMAFDVAGGSASQASLTKHVTDSFAMPDPGTKTGYTFAGWSDGTNTLGLGANFTVGTSSKNFVAQWTANVYTVSYNWNGGTGTPTSNASYTYGTAGITLPSGASHTRDGYTFAGWSVLWGGPAVSDGYIPVADTMLFARWVDGSYAISLNAHGGTLAQTSASVSRGTSMTLPVPTRAGFVFDGWYEDAANTMLVGAANASFTPARTQTLHAKWVQNSLAGINPAHINSLASFSVTGAHSWSGTHTASGTGAVLTVPAGALPTGTDVKLSFIEDLSRPRSIIDTSYAYYTSVAVHWLSGSGDSATVPTTAVNRPLTLVLTNPAILPGAKVFMIIGGVATEVATATLAGEVTINFTQDPEFVIAATKPSIPASVSATPVASSQATVNWSAPATTGGAPITGYTVTAMPGGATCSTTVALTCVVNGLSEGTTYSYSVIASNAIGSSQAAATTVNYVPAPAASPSSQNSSGAPVVAGSSSRAAAPQVTSASPSPQASPSAASSTAPEQKTAAVSADQPAPVSPFIWFILLALALLLLVVIVLIELRRRAHKQN